MNVNNVQFGSFNLNYELRLQDKYRRDQVLCGDAGPKLFVCRQQEFLDKYRILWLSKLLR